MFFRLKKSGPRSYLQIVENRRDGRSVRQHVIATIWRIDELAARGGLATLLASGARFCEQVMLLSALDDPEQAARLSCKRIGGPLCSGTCGKGRWTRTPELRPHRLTPDGVGASAPRSRPVQHSVPFGLWRAPLVPSGKVNDTVNLIGSGRDKAHEGRPHERLCPIHDHHTRHASLALQQLAEQFGGPLVPPLLDKNVEHEAILVHRPPEPVLRSPDHQAHFVEVPLVAGPGSRAGSGWRNPGRTCAPTGARPRGSRRYRGPPASLPPCAGSAESGNRATPRG